MLPVDSVNQLVPHAMYKQSVELIVPSLRRWRRLSAWTPAISFLPLVLEKLDSVSFIYLQHCARCLNPLMP